MKPPYTIPVEPKNGNPSIYIKDEALKQLSLNGMDLWKCSDDLKNDPDVVLTAIKQTHIAFQYASAYLKNNKSFVLRAIKADKMGQVFKYSNKRLTFDRSVVWASLNVHGTGLEYACNELKDDFDTVMKALDTAWIALEHASERLKNNKEICKKALSKNLFAYRHVSDEMKKNPDIIKFMFVTSLADFFVLKRSVLMSNNEYQNGEKSIDSFLNNLDEYPTFYIKLFKQINDKFVKEYEKEVSFIDFNSTAREGMEFILSKITEQKYIDLLESKVPEINEMISRKRILNIENKSSVSTKKKDRKLKF